MTQASPIIGANKSGLSYRQEDNDGKKALLNHHKAPSAPEYAEAGTIWLDDAATLWLLKAHDGADWITLGEINAGTDAFQPYVGGSTAKFLNFAEDTGGANAYAVAPAPAITAYAAGQIVTLKPDNAVSGASTLNVNGLGAKTIKMPDGSDTGANAMVTTGVYMLVYDGTYFVLLNTSSAANFLLARGTAVASASTTNIGAANSDYVEIGGTTTITSLGSTTTRNHVWVKFQGALTLTHNATSLILPTGASIATAAGDVAEFVRISGANWQCLSYIPANGKPLAAIARADLPAGAVLQSVSATYAANEALGSIPNDDTVPQNTEGLEVATVSITPTSASSVIEVSFNGFASGSASALIIAALFKDSGADALQATCCTAGSANLPNPLVLVHRETSGDTSARTYKIRVGTSGGSGRMNGTTSGRFFGGAASALLIAREIKA